MTQADSLRAQLANSKTEIAVEEPKKKTIASELERMRPQLERALPKHLSSDRLLRVALTTIRNNPKIAECSPSSLMGAVMQAAQVGLEPDALGSCYLVPYNRRYKDDNDQWQSVKEVQFQIGYKGMIELVRRTGQVTSIVANAVHQNDEFQFEYGLNENLRHKPIMTGERGEVIAFYAYARFKDGGHAFAVMSVDDVNQVRDKFTKSKNQKGEIFGTWVDHYESMAKKTVIKQLIKYMPISVEVQQDIIQDETIKPDISSDPMTIIDMTENEPS